MPDFIQRLFTHGMLRLALCSTLCLIVPLGHAAAITNLYSVEIPVVNQNIKIRQSAFNQGLREVLIRVTGDRNIFSLIKMPRSSSYVKQFQYRELEKGSKHPANGSTDNISLEKKHEPRQLLWVQFNETKVNEFVRNNTLPLWGKYRRDTLLWLAVNDGFNRYVLKDSDESLLKTAVNESAVRRAIPVIWPQISRVEQAIRFADVWSGLSLPLTKISNTYSGGPIIIGRLQWKDEQWNSEWTLLMDGNKTEWASEHSDYKKLLFEAIDTIADLMGQEFALFDSGNLSSYHSLAIQINNVNSIVALNSVKQYLSSVPIVQKIAIERIENNRVFLDVSLRTNTEDFLKSLQIDSKLLLLPDEVVVSDLQKNISKKSAQTNLAHDDKVTAAGKAAYQFQFQP